MSWWMVRVAKSSSGPPRLKATQLKMAMFRNHICRALRMRWRPCNHPPSSLKRTKCNQVSIYRLSSFRPCSKVSNSSRSSSNNPNLLNFLAKVFFNLSQRASRRRWTFRSSATRHGLVSALLSSATSRSLVSGTQTKHCFLTRNLTLILIGKSSDSYPGIRLLNTSTSSSPSDKLRARTGSLPRFLSPWPGKIWARPAPTVAWAPSTKR